MYEGCVSLNNKKMKKNKNCKKSGLAKAKSIVILDKMNLITPTTMIGEFNDDVNIEFNLVD